MPALRASADGIASPLDTRKSMHFATAPSSDIHHLVPTWGKTKVTLSSRQWRRKSRITRSAIIGSLFIVRPSRQVQQLIKAWKYGFKRNRNLDGGLNKHKARICCHGGQQDSWTLWPQQQVHRLCPSLSSNGSWCEDLHGEPEFGQALGYTLFLLRNLHGLTQGSYNWYQKLRWLDRKGLCSFYDWSLPRPSQKHDCAHLRRWLHHCWKLNERDRRLHQIIVRKKGGLHLNWRRHYIDKFLGAEIVDRGRGEFEMKQPHEFPKSCT